MRTGHFKTQRLPDLPADQRQRITEGWLRLVVPSCLPDRQFAPAGVLMRQQRDQREQPQQHGRCTQDRQIRPLALSLHAQMLPHLVISHFDLPTQHEPLHDLHRVSLQVLSR